METKLKITPLTIGILILALFLIGVGILYSQNKKTATVAPTKTSLVPQLQFQTNPLVGNVPEVNPLEKVNPFKYKNPLR